MNVHGWMKRAENEVKDYINDSLYDQMLRQKIAEYEPLKSQYEYTMINTAEYAPEIANELVTIYFDEHIQGHLKRDEVIDLTQHLCNWLFV